MKMLTLVAALAVAAVSAAGCIRAPDLVIVDRTTALEQQAAGNYRPLSDELERAGIVPRAAPLTRGQLDAAGVRAARPEEALADVEAESDATQLDALLLRRCLGEARDGTIVETPKSCTGAIDAARVTRLIERTNRNRWQIWRYLQTRRPSTPMDEIRRVWRETHLSGVVCDAPVESTAGAWEPKKC